MKYTFKGVVRGAFSYWQAAGYESDTPVVETFAAETLHDLIRELIIDEWVFVLKVNGRKIKNPMSYIKRQGLNPYDYTRDAAEAEYHAGQAAKAI